MEENQSGQNARTDLALYARVDGRRRGSALGHRARHVLGGHALDRVATEVRRLLALDLLQGPQDLPSLGVRPDPEPAELAVAGQGIIWKFLTQKYRIAPWILKDRSLTCPNIRYLP